MIFVIPFFLFIIVDYISNLMDYLNQVYRRYWKYLIKIPLGKSIINPMKLVGIIGIGQQGIEY